MLSLKVSEFPLCLQSDELNRLFDNLTTVFGRLWRVSKREETLRGGDAEAGMQVMQSTAVKTFHAG